MKITPTVGRKVWYRPSEFDITGEGMMIVTADRQPLDATIVAVYGNGNVNLDISDSIGQRFARLDISLVEPGCADNVGGYAEWMPYQLAQAGIKPIDFGEGSQVDPSMARPSTRLVGMDLGRAMLANAAPSPTKGPSVSEEEINILMASLTYETARIPGTTSTVATARLPGGFVVAVGHEAVVSPENFDAALGKQYAIGTATKLAREKLWEFEGYVLAKQLGRTMPTPAQQPGQFDAFAPHQSRVLEEHAETVGRLNRLQAFLVTPMFDGLPEAEQARLRKQATIMTDLVAVLAERIAEF